jgi:uncharacterized membrane protein (TIGR02234 family)
VTALPQPRIDPPTETAPGAPAPAPAEPAGAADVQQGADGRSATDVRPNAAPAGATGPAGDTRADAASADADAHPDADAQSGADPAAGVPGRARGDRRSLALMLLFAVVGASVVLLAAGRTWSRGQVAFQGSAIHVSATGAQTTGVPGALALVALASAVAVFAVRGFGRRLVGVLLALAGAAALAVCVTAATGSAELNRKAAAAVGLSHADATGVTHSAWPWLGVVGGVLLVLAGLLVITRGRDWPGMSSRYEAPERRRVGRSGPAAARSAAASAARSTAAAEPATPADFWKALDRGEDPTA